MFRCKQCGSELHRWQGRCSRCGTWGSLEAKARVERTSSGTEAARAPPQPVPLAEVATQPLPRRSTGFAELDRVLGGGLVPGSTVLLGGEPGIGKSTLLLAVCDRTEGPVLYVAGEESPAQVALRARRLGLGQLSAGGQERGDGLALVDCTDPTRIAALLETERPALCVVDSIQSMRSPEASGLAGGPGQVRAAADVLVPAARASGCALVLVGQVTKIGGIAGPRLLEHAVDTVVFFEGHRHQSVRALRSIKNRFGACDEIGLFEMGDKGLEEVRDASRLLLAEHGQAGPGSVVACVVEGRRAICVEVQALLVGTDRATPRRRARGVDPRRCELLTGVVESHYSAAIARRDVFVNVAGGLTVTDPGLDLALAIAVLSAQLRAAPPQDAVLLGEVGLRGEVRPVGHTQLRLKEIKALGFRSAYAPRGTAPIPGLALQEVRNVHDVLRPETTASRTTAAGATGPSAAARAPP